MNDNNCVQCRRLIMRQKTMMTIICSLSMSLLFHVVMEVSDIIVILFELPFSKGKRSTYLPHTFHVVFRVNWVTASCCCVNCVVINIATADYYCYYCRPVLILANFSDFVIIANFCLR